MLPAKAFGSSRETIVRVSQQGLAQAHGLFNVVSGVWPLVSMGTFERVTGPKVDGWLVRTVSGLLVSIGVAQLAAGDSPEGLRVARLLGQSTATTLGVIDIVYASSGRISKVYLADAVVETAWVALWAASRRS
jgi:hypothetical protein